MTEPAATAGLTVVVMGTGPFVLPTFAALVDSPHRVVAVVTRPERAARGRRPPPNPMRLAAERAGLPVLDPADVNAAEVRQDLASLQPDLFVVCDFGQILSAETLAIPPLGGVNLHGSLLPRHRGAAPVQWAILCGDETTGVSTIHMTPALDAGNVITSRQTAIGSRETAAELEPRLAELGGPAVLEAVGILEAARRATPPGRPVPCGLAQDARLATRAPRLTKRDGLVDWSQTAEELDRRRRALEPWPRLTALVPQAGGSPRRLVLADTAVSQPRAAAQAAPPGTVVETDAAGLLIACGGPSLLAIRKVVPEGRRPMAAADFLRGSPLRVGSQLAGDTAAESR